MLELPTTWKALKETYEIWHTVQWKAASQSSNRAARSHSWLWLVHSVWSECTQHENRRMLAEEQQRWGRGGWEVLGLPWQCLEHRQVTADLCSRGWSTQDRDTGHPSPPVFFYYHQQTITETLPFQPLLRLVFSGVKYVRIVMHVLSLETFVSPNGNSSIKELLILHPSQPCFSIHFLVLPTNLTT